MSGSYRQRGSNIFWVVLLLATVMSASIGALIWLTWSCSPEKPAESASVITLSSHTIKVGEDAPKRAVASSPSGGRPNMQVNAGVEHDEAGAYHNIFINAAGATLKNKVAQGDLVISASAGEGGVYLENVVVKGRIIADGGSLISLKNVTAAGIVAQKSGGGTRFLVSGRSTIHNITAVSRLSVEQSEIASGYSGVKEITAEDGAVLWRSQQHIDA